MRPLRRRAAGAAGRRCARSPAFADPPHGGKRAQPDARSFDFGARFELWARDFFEAIEAHAHRRVYVNFLGDEGRDRVRAAYGAEAYRRLVELKRTYDPTNVFRLNQNIEP